MVKCPICKREIKEVKRVYVKYAYDILFIDEEGRFREFIDEDGTDWAFHSYECPECLSDLDFGSDKEVEEFLRGKKEEK
jgi:uncharacterized protein with PIN domain